MHTTSCIAEEVMGYLEKGKEMKIPKTTPILAIAVVIIGALATVLAPSPVEALTKAQQQACQDKWAGNYAASSQKVKDYRNSKCPTSKGGNCTSSNQRLPKDGGGEEIRTTIKCPVSGKDGGGNNDTPPADNGGETIDGCGDIKTSIIKCNTRGGNPVMSILIQVINFLAVGVGIAVVGGIIWGGMIYASSNGDSAKTKQAITIIVNAVVGLLLFMFMYALINFIVPGGLFT